MSIIDKINDFLRCWPGAEYGPAHVVLSDYNLNDEFLCSAIKRICEEEPDRPKDELRATLEFLTALKQIPEDERDVILIDDIDAT